MLFALSPLPSRAARPLLDQHQWDAYFALFARDVNVPWKPASVRLDTYSGAPVEFAVYNVDPADVIVAGQNRTPHALDTSGRKPLIRFRYTPPPGFRFESNDVEVPLGSQEGFYVVEARRGDAVQQVWLNRTHIGLVTKESPEGLLIWGVDLRSGKALAHMSVAFLVGLQLVTKTTDANGTIFWSSRPRPAFALAENGAGRAFVSMLPQAPLPATLVDIQLESAVARAGANVRFAGFVRRRTGGVYRRATGDVKVTLIRQGRTLASTSVQLDAAGAFNGEFAVPPDAEAGDDAVLAAAAGGGVGGTTVHVDAASDVTLSIESRCPCDADKDVTIGLLARSGALPAPDVSIHVVVVRAPHIVAPGANGDTPRWGTSLVLSRTVKTDATGRAAVTISNPTDGLDSTYGVSATTRGATATSRIAVPVAKVALALEPERPSADVGEPIAFSLRGFDPSDGTPAAGLDVSVRLSHGATVQEQSVKLDERGSAHVIFHQPSLGSNLALADALVGGRHALDAAAVLVEPSALSGNVGAGAAASVSLDKARYRPGDPVVVTATAPGANGDALLTLEGARTYQAVLAPVRDGRAGATVNLDDAQGDVRAGVAFVRDGAIVLGTTQIAVDGPGHRRMTQLELDKTAYAPGDMLHASLRDGANEGATLVLRIADGRESGAALFDGAPDVLLTGGTTSQNPASDTPAWHAYVAPARSKASDIFAAENPQNVATEVPALAAAAPRTLLWRVERGDGASLDLPVPKERGTYVLSILKIADDGDVGAVSASFTVQ